jgi:hypothetical protein
MSSKGESSITKVSRNGMRQKEFDSLFYMRDALRRQYILDRYLKRLPKGGVKLNTAFQARTEIGTDKGDDEDLTEAYQRGWIDFQDILKYYTPSSEGVVPPSLLKRQDIIMTNLIRKSSLPKTRTSLKKPSKEKKVNMDDKKEFDAYFDSLEKKEKGKRSTKTTEILLNKGFSNMSVNDTKIRNKFKKLKTDLSKSKQENIKLSEIKPDPKETDKQAKKRKEKEEKDKKQREKEKAMKFPMWKKAQDAENYKNEKYNKVQDSRNKLFLRGRLTQGLTNKEKIKSIEDDLKLLGLTSLKRNISELKTREDKRRSTIFLGNLSLKRKASSGSRKSSISSSKKSSVSSRRGSTGSRRSSVNSVSGYSSPVSSTKSSKDLWSDSY